jgi:hypothetical protein
MLGFRARWLFYRQARAITMNVISVLGWVESPLVLKVQGRLDPSKVSGVGTIFWLLVYVLPGPTKQRACKPSGILS